MDNVKQKTKKIELLAPAGNFAALRGAIMAGADAVYLGGNRFGARAYAENFTQEEICEGIRMAHVFGRKVYLTVNTLVRDGETAALLDFLLPFYEYGLDGVILQDLGALHVIRKYFPELSLHASTQMTLTGVHGVKLLQRAGISRIVPARELSLQELVQIKKETGIETEVFVHGAMCYCYSGQCLFSSILGGRSGNRGRCAQPCRLPYRVEGQKESYPLSMRDMCALTILPELIDAGMDSLKIEGRMKKPVYAAGVTAIYRKYIDAYYEKPEQFRIEEQDMEALKALYIRSELSEGYYHKHSGRDMLTLDSPAYSGSDEKLLAEIERKYLQVKPYKTAQAEVVLQPGRPAGLVLRAFENPFSETDELAVSVKGDIAQTALKQPLTREKVAEQIEKSGNTLIEIRCEDIKMEEPVFLPIRALNELRRSAVEQLENQMIREWKLPVRRNGREATEINLTEPGEKYRSKNTLIRSGEVIKNSANTQLHASVMNLQQFQAARDRHASRIYLNYSLALEKQSEYWKHETEGQVCELFLISPYILRSDHADCLERLRGLLETSAFQGILVKNLESAAYFEHCKKQIVLDSNLYFWNRYALDEIKGLMKEASCMEEFFLPAECNIHEWKELVKHGTDRGMCPSVQVYGRLPMMVTANCIRKTAKHCSGKSGWMELTDRYHKIFPVYTDCNSCYNVIYNSVPLSLHGMIRQNELQGVNFRLDFTTETGGETRDVLQYFQEACREEPFYQEYTTGHYKRGAE